MFGIDTFHERSFHRFGSLTGLKPVHVWIGKIDEPADLKGWVTEPVVSCLIRSLREGMPEITHAPIFLSAMLMDPHEKIAPFDLGGSEFFDRYGEWRAAVETDNATGWTMPPAEVYNDAMRALLQGKAR